MKKWIAIILLMVMLGNMVCYADASKTEELEIILEDDSKGPEDELDIEMESPERSGDGGILPDDVFLENSDSINLELDTGLTGNDIEIDLSSSVLTNSVESSIVYGVWKGKYVERKNGNTVDRAIRLDIDHVNNGTIEGIATIDGGENGSYFFDGTLNVKSGNVEFRGTDWIDNPNGLGFHLFSGILNEAEKTIEGTVDGKANNTFILHKTSDAYSTKRIDIQAVPRDWKGKYDARYNSATVRRSYEMHIQNVDNNGGISGIAHVSPDDKADSNPGANGSYYFSGTIDGRRGKIKIQGIEWIEYPDHDEEFVPLEGFFDASLASIIGKSGDGIWKMKSYDSELGEYYSTQPVYPITIRNADGTKVKFNESLERYVTNMDSDKYYPDLAYMLVALAGAAYHKVGTQRGLLTVENAGYQSDSRELEHITKAYKDLGFNDYQVFNYYNNPDDPAYGEDNVAFSIGRKQLSDDDALVLIVVRGSYGDFPNPDKKDVSFSSDWRSNVNINTNARGWHLGFAHAADKAYSALKSFMKNRRYSGSTMKSNVRYVITGHSRGAAVANLLALKLYDMGVPDSKVYDYNFACPDMVKDSEKANLKNHKNIFNICNSADAISVIPGIVGDAVNLAGYVGGDRFINKEFKDLFVGWDKYGKTRFYCNNWNDPKEFNLARTFDGNNSSHGVKHYIQDIGRKTYKLYSWSEIAARGIQLGVGIILDKIIRAFYPKYAIVPEDIAKAKVTVSDQVFTGKALKPKVKVVLNNKTLKKDKDYTVSYENNENIGMASVILKGKGNYLGTKTVTFRINPRPVKGFKLTAGKGQISARWDKAAGIDGYQLQYSLKKSFTSAREVTVDRATVVNKVLEGLKKNDVYYMRIRAYKTVNGETYWSAWSGTKKAKVK